jgi:O-antigen/teichoic acid export membrane protein
MVVLALAWGASTDRGRVVVMAGLVLIPSALASDVGLRASCRFGGLALTQAIRAVGLAVGVAWLVSSSGDALLAAGCVVMAEIASTMIILSIHWSEHGPIRPRFRRRATAILARRGSVAGLTRLARVSLFALDLLILGSLLAATELGPYAAARRVAFALLALGLVVPSAIAPRIAREWAIGVTETRSYLGMTIERMLILVLPAAVGLILTAGRWMDWLFGAGFADGGIWLALIAARLPFVLVSNLQQTALIACRRERWSLWLMVGMAALTGLVIPPLAISNGAWGVGWGVLAVEIGGALAGWVALGRMGIAPRWHHARFSTLLGCVALALVCLVGADWPLPLVVIVAALVYGLVVGAPWLRRVLLSFRSSELAPVLSGGPLT